MMNIKRIIREELEDGFKGSNEEDWEWTEDIKPEFHIGDRVRTLKKDDFRLSELDDNFFTTDGGYGWVEGYEFTIGTTDIDPNRPTIVFPAREFNDGTIEDNWNNASDEFGNRASHSDLNPYGHGLYIYAIEPV